MAGGWEGLRELLHQHVCSNVIAGPGRTKQTQPALRQPTQRDPERGGWWLDAPFPSNEWWKGGKSKLSIKRLGCRDLTFRGGGNRKLSKTFRKLGLLFHLFLAHMLFPLLVFIHVLNIFVSTPELFSSTGLLPSKKAPCCCGVSHVFDSRGGFRWSM